MDIRRAAAYAFLVTLSSSPAMAQIARTSIRAPLTGTAHRMDLLQPFNAIHKDQLERLRIAPSAEQARELGRLAALPLPADPAAALPIESAKLIMHGLTHQDARRDGGTWWNIYSKFSPSLHIKLDEVSREIQAQASADGALRGELAEAKTESPEAVLARLDEIFSGGQPSASWLGSLPQEPGGFSGGYIVPNEHNSHLYAPVLKGKPGALISVGTFRSLNDAAMGEFSHVVLLDQDHMTTAYNRSNVDLIANSRDRFEYLANLFGANPAEVEPLLRDVRAGRLSDKMFLGLLNSSKVGGSRFDIGPALSKAAENSAQWNSTYYGSDAGFAKIRKMALDGRILAVSGDLAGARVMPAIARGLTERGIQVSAVDISNAHESVYSRWSEFIGNLRALPLRPDASVLFTGGSGVYNPVYFRKPPSTLDGDWLYFAVQAERMLEDTAHFVDDAATRGWNQLISYFNSLMQASDPKLRAKGLIVPSKSQ